LKAGWSAVCGCVENAQRVETAAIPSLLTYATLAFYDHLIGTFAVELRLPDASNNSISSTSLVILAIAGLDSQSITY